MLAGLALAACNGAPGPAVASGVQAVSGSEQYAVAGSPAANPLVVLVTDDNGNPFPNGTVAWTVVANSARAQAAAAARAGDRGEAVLAAAYRHALASGFDRAFLVAAGIALLIILTAITAIRIPRAGLTGAQPR